MGEHVEVFRGKRRITSKSRWYFRGVAANGEIVFQSEGYQNRLGAYHGVRVSESIFNGGKTKIFEDGVRMDEYGDLWEPSPLAAGDAAP